jgi:hypothetical protein
MRVKVVRVGETQTVGESGFRKRDLIGKIEGEYENIFHFEFVQDKVDLLDEVLEGTYITVFYNIRCREVEKDNGDKLYFTSLSGWKIES